MRPRPVRLRRACRATAAASPIANGPRRFHGHALGQFHMDVVVLDLGDLADQSASRDHFVALGEIPRSSRDAPFAGASAGRRMRNHRISSMPRSAGPSPSMRAARLPALPAAARRSISMKYLSEIGTAVDPRNWSARVQTNQVFCRSNWGLRKCGCLRQQCDAGERIACELCLPCSNTRPMRRRLHWFRDVAQPGSAPHWGCGGRRFRILSSRPVDFPPRSNP